MVSEIAKITFNLESWWCLVNFVITRVCMSMVVMITLTKIPIKKIFLPIAVVALLAITATPIHEMGHGITALLLKSTELEGFKINSSAFVTSVNWKTASLEDFILVTIAGPALETLWLLVIISASILTKNKKAKEILYAAAFVILTGILMYYLNNEEGDWKNLIIYTRNVAFSAFMLGARIWVYSLWLILVVYSEIRTDRFKTIGTWINKQIAKRAEAEQNQKVPLIIDKPPRV